MIRRSWTPFLTLLLKRTQLILLALALCACGLQKKEVAVTGGNGGKPPGPGNGSEKPTVNTPPLFAENQLKAGQWLEWQRTSPKGVKDCVRWLITDINQDGIYIESRTSRKCTAPDENSRQVEHILFVPETGYVKMDVIKTDGITQEPGPLNKGSIFGHIYGNPEKVTYFDVIWKNAEGVSYSAYKVKDRTYYNKANPNHPFHGFALAFKETDKTGDYQYQYKQSEPSLEAVPKDP